MIQHFKVLFDNPIVRTVVIGYAKRAIMTVIDKVRGRARQEFNDALDDMSFGEFIESRFEVDDVRDSNVLQSIIYLSTHVVDVTVDGTLTVTIAGIDIVDTNLFNLEAKMYRILKAGVDAIDLD